MATAMMIINTWWYPIIGMNPADLLALVDFRVVMVITYGPILLQHAWAW
jgi:hypothetical protein